MDKIFTIEKILQARPWKNFTERFSGSILTAQNIGIWRLLLAKNLLLRGIKVAMYIVGQERRLVDPPSQVVAGVRTVTTNMDGRDALPRMSRPFAFLRARIRPCTGCKSH